MDDFKIFNVMLEGAIDEKTGFLVTIEVAARSKKEAGNLAVKECSRSETENLRIEEIEIKTEDSEIKSAQVVKVYGKSYFPLSG